MPLFTTTLSLVGVGVWVLTAFTVSAGVEVAVGLGVRDGVGVFVDSGVEVTMFLGVGVREDVGETVKLSDPTNLPKAAGAEVTLGVIVVVADVPRTFGLVSGGTVTPIKTANPITTPIIDNPNFFLLIPSLRTIQDGLMSPIGRAIKLRRNEITTTVITVTGIIDHS